MEVIREGNFVLVGPNGTNDKINEKMIESLGVVVGNEKEVYSKVFTYKGATTREEFGELINEVEKLYLAKMLTRSNTMLPFRIRVKLFFRRIWQRSFRR